jgi:hypothetical protein
MSFDDESSDGQTNLALAVLLNSGFAHHGLDVLHQKEQVKRIGWAGIKLPMEKSLPGRLVLSMYQHRTNSGNIRHISSAQKRIFEQRYAKLCAWAINTFTRNNLPQRSLTCLEPHFDERYLSP